MIPIVYVCFLKVLGETIDLISVIILLDNLIRIYAHTNWIRNLRDDYSNLNWFGLNLVFNMYELGRNSDSLWEILLPFDKPVTQSHTCLFAYHPLSQQAAVLLKTVHWLPLCEYF